MTTSLSTSSHDKLVARSRAVATQFEANHPGDSDARQPVHTVYGGAQLFRADRTVRIGAGALSALKAYAQTPDELVAALKITGIDAAELHGRVLAKLEREAVEDFRIDFEDGYGNRPDDEEDAEAVRCGQEVAAGMAAGTLSPFIGIRTKTLSRELTGRALKTLDLFVTSLVTASGGALPPGFVVTLPKIVDVEQVTILADALDELESACGLTSGAIPIELMVETPQSIMDESGRCPLPAFVDAGRGRVRAAHFGTYDYTASCGITAAFQHMRHPACDNARHAMQVALAGRGIHLSDGATNIMPVGPHRAAPGEVLTAEQEDENRRVVHRAWQIMYGDVRHSLEHAYYQGWDLHPSQLVVRYAAVYAFFLEGYTAAADRLSSFIEQAAKATLLGDVFDDAATGQGLLNFFLRGLACGALTEAECTATGLSIAELRTRSFLAIVEGRR